MQGTNGVSGFNQGGVPFNTGAEHSVQDSLNLAPNWESGTSNSSDTNWLPLIISLPTAVGTLIIFGIVVACVYKFIIKPSAEANYQGIGTGGVSKKSQNDIGADPSEATFSVHDDWKKGQGTETPQVKIKVKTGDQSEVNSDNTIYFSDMTSSTARTWEEDEQGGGSQGGASVPTEGTPLKQNNPQGRNKYSIVSGEGGNDLLK